MKDETRKEDGRSRKRDANPIERRVCQHHTCISRDDRQCLSVIKREKEFSVLVSCFC
jgi:hypothetical protein